MENTTSWLGKSGAEYKFYVYEIGTNLKDMPGNYIYAKEMSPRKWRALSIGETISLKKRMPSPDELRSVETYGGTHVHVHIDVRGEKARRAEVADLIEKWNPPCRG